jgi:hypothetical protein
MPEEVRMPYYVHHMANILDEIGIPNIKANMVRVDEYVQQILGTRDLDAEEVWAILQPRLEDPAWRKNFVEQLRDKWNARDWRQGLLS